MVRCACSRWRNDMPESGDKTMPKSEAAVVVVGDVACNWHVLAKAGRDPLPWLSERRGLFHLAGWGISSRLYWAKKILAEDPRSEKQLVRQVIPAKSPDFRTKAIRPRYSALDCSKFLDTFEMRMPDWDHSLRLAMQTK